MNQHELADQYLKPIYNNYYTLLTVYAVKLIQIFQSPKNYTIIKEIAEEIVIESFVKLWNKVELGKKNSIDEIEFFLMKATHHGAFAYINLIKTLEGQSVSSSVTWERNSDILYILCKRLHTVYVKINQLPNRYAKVLKLHFGRKSVPQIAKELRLSVSTIRYYLKRTNNILNAIEYKYGNKKVETANNIIPNKVADNENLIYSLLNDYSILQKLPYRKFEMLIARLFEHMGYNVSLTPNGPDGGKDVIAIRTIPPSKELVIYIQCKNYSSGRKIGIDKVREFMYTIQNEKVNAGFIVSTASFSRVSWNFQKENNSFLSFYGVRDITAWIINNIEVAEYQSTARLNTGQL